MKVWRRVKPVAESDNVPMIEKSVAHEWARVAFQEGKDAGYREAVLSLERSITEAVKARTGA